MQNKELFFVIFNQSGRYPFLDSLMIFGADPLIYIVLILILLLAIKDGIKERKSLVLFLFLLAILIIIIKFIHLFFFEQRPYISNEIIPLISYNFNDASFPSRHTAIAFCIAFSFIYFRSRWALLIFILAIWISFSRIYVGVHYPLDILGGILTALISIFIAIGIIKALKRRLRFN